jgi:DNA replication ATP-dependent helicase Dna2
MRLQEAAGRPSPTDTLRQLRQLLEQLFRYLTKEETRGFGNLFARMQFFFDKHPVPAALQEQLTALRILTHKAVIGTLIADEELSLICIKTMACAIQHFCKVPIPAVLERQYVSVQERTLNYTPQFSAALVPQLKCLITDIGPLQKRSDQAPYFFVELPQ